MTTPRTYKLEIHIDSQQITKESLEQKTNHVLCQYLEKNSISLEINTPNSSCHQLIINGDIESVDQCHNKIQQKIINEGDLKFPFGSLVDRAISFSNHQKLLTTLI